MYKNGTISKVYSVKSEVQYVCSCCLKGGKAHICMCINSKMSWTCKLLAWMWSGRLEAGRSLYTLCILNFEACECLITKINAIVNIKIFCNSSVKDSLI